MLKKNTNMALVFINITLTIALMAFFLTFQPARAHAELPIYSQNGFDLALTLDAAAGVFTTSNSNFGAATSAGKENVDWSEAYFKPVLNASYAANNLGEIYSGFSYVASGTFGDGDPSEFTSSDSDGFESEQRYLGFKTGQFASFGISNLDISVGEQEFAIGDGFLIMDGEFDSSYGAYWLNPHLSFKNTAIIKSDIGAVHTEFFFLQADEDSGDTELYGLNIEYNHETLGTVGASYLTVTDVDSTGDYALRDNMDVYSVRGQGTPLANLGQENLFLAFEYVHQGGGEAVDIDANGYYLEAGYTLADLPWSPTLSYKYAFFSGDDSSDSKNQAFDPLFYSMGRGWGSHIMGEIVGEYYLFNSNQKVHMVSLNLQPSEALATGILFYDFSLDEKNYYGTSVSDDKFAQEIDLYADYSLTDNLFLTATLAWATPKGAAKQSFANDEDSYLAQLAVYLSF